jgi:myosin heavy subunit
MSAEKYFYLNQGGSYSIDGKNDQEDFLSLQSSMQVNKVYL